MAAGALLVRHDRASAAVVRHRIAADLAAEDIEPDAIDDVILVASELVGNAVVHSGDTSDLDVTWDLLDDEVTIRVHDFSPALPQIREPDVFSGSGRGLAIVAAIASDWGVNRSDPGKQVWARVGIARQRAS